MGIFRRLRRRTLSAARQGRKGRGSDPAHAFARNGHSGVAQAVWTARTRAESVGKAALLDAWPVYHHLRGDPDPTRPHL
eukprot:5949026-Pleurochrysis_carterae.AAC.1